MPELLARAIRHATWAGLCCVLVLAAGDATNWRQVIVAGGLTFYTFVYATQVRRSW
jgi:hypothetical protein